MLCLSESILHYIQVLCEFCEMSVLELQVTRLSLDPAVNTEGMMQDESLKAWALILILTGFPCSVFTMVIETQRTFIVL